MKPLLLWIAVPLMLLGASTLVAGVGSTGLWIAAVTVGIALVVIWPGQAGHGGPAVTEHSAVCPMHAQIAIAADVCAGQHVSAGGLMR
jgi:hypothetical protein